MRRDVLDAGTELKVILASIAGTTVVRNLAFAPSSAEPAVYAAIRLRVSPIAKAAVVSVGIQPPRISASRHPIRNAFLVVVLHPLEHVLFPSNFKRRYFSYMYFPQGLYNINRDSNEEWK